jgi:hypothetical protein
MELESELACDLAVVRDSPERRATYAECLVRFARLHAAQEPTPWNLDFAGSSIQLKVRVRSVLTETVKLPAWLLGLRTSMGMLLLAAFLFMAPSLCVVLSYARRAAQPVVPSLISSQTRIRPRKKSLPHSMVRQSLGRDFATPTETTAPASQSVASLTTPQNVSRLPDTLSSGGPVPTLQQRGAAGTETVLKPAHATVYFISNPSSVGAGNPDGGKGRSIASALMTGATEAARFAGSHGKDVH